MRELAELIAAWWKRDRIRASPSEGRLFRLRPGAVVCLPASSSQPQIDAEVVARLGRQLGQCPAVAYRCLTGQGEGELRVSCREDGRPRVEWMTGGQSYELPVDEIEVF